MSTEETPEERDQSREKWWRFGAALHMDLAHVTRLNTMKLVLFVARQTFGWRCRAAIMSYDEILHGRWVGSNRQKDVSGLKNDAGISEAIKDAIKRGLLIVRQTNFGPAYLIPDSYWIEAGIAPEREFWEYAPPWTTYIVELAQVSIADSAIESAEASKTAMVSQAKQRGNLSTPLRNPEQSDQETIAAPSRGDSPEAAPRAPLDTSPDTSSTYFNQDTLAAAPPAYIDKNEKEEKTEETDPSPSKPTSHTMQTDATSARSAGTAPRRPVDKEQPIDKAVIWWGYVKEDMRAQINPAAWDNWFAATRGLRVEGRALVVYAPAGAHAQLAHRFKDRIAAILDGRVRPGINVRYTHEEDNG